MTRHERAAQLVDEGMDNAHIIATLKSEFGLGISKSTLARVRAGAPQREKQRAREELEAAQAERYDFIKGMLEEGHKAFQCQQACKERFGKSVGYDTIRKLVAELNGDPENAIIPIELPPEILEDEPPGELVEPEDAISVVPPHGPNGTLVNIKAIQQWMRDINAESLTLTTGGRLSVLARHDFEIGGLE